MVRRFRADQAFAAVSELRLGEFAGPICRATLGAFMGDASARCLSRRCDELCEPARRRESAGAATDTASRNQRDRPGRDDVQRSVVSQVASPGYAFYAGETR